MFNAKRSLEVDESSRSAANRSQRPFEPNEFLSMSIALGKADAEKGGYNNFKGNEEDFEDDDEELVLRTEEINLQTKKDSYVVEMKLFKNLDYEKGMVEVSVTLKLKKNGNMITVGNLDGTIIRRPSKCFHEMGDSISGELEELTSMFCNNAGAATRISTGLKGRDIYSGGFFHISTVSISKEQRGQDLGLQLVHKAMVFTRNEWNLVVLQPGPLNDSIADDLDAPLSEDEKEDQFRLAKERIARHWARMGFRQAGRNAEECGSWFMISSLYFSSADLSGAGFDGSAAVEKWKTKKQVASLDIFIPPKMHKPKGSDKKLHELIQKHMHAIQNDTHFSLFYPAPVLSPAALNRLTEDVMIEINELVGNGGSACFERSRALFVLTTEAHFHHNDDINNAIASFLQHLIQLGADVNAKDENKNGSLHIAARKFNPILIKALIDSGASQSLRNDKGLTPFDVLQNELELQSDCSIQYTAPNNVNQQLDSINCFLSRNTRETLIDGWLPPRMMEMLRTTAGIGFDEIRESEWGFVKFQSMSLQQCREFLLHFDFIPPKVFKRNPKGFYNSFRYGWEKIWEAMYKIVERNQVPSLTRVKDEIHRMGVDNRKMQHFYDKGGEIKYALDALINITRDVYVHGDCGWEYVTFKDNIEKFPATPLDSLYGLAKVKCLEIGPDDRFGQPAGPYFHEFDDEYDDGMDDLFNE